MSGNRAVAYMGPKKLEIQDLDFPRLIDPQAPSEHSVVKWPIKESACPSSLPRWTLEPAATADRAGITVF